MLFRLFLHIDCSISVFILSCALFATVKVAFYFRLNAGYYYGHTQHQTVPSVVL